MAVGDEQSRNWTERQWDYQLQKEGATYDRTRTHLNFEIAPGAKIVSMGTNKKIGDRFKERCKELGLGDPNFKIDKATGKLIPTNRVTTAWIQLGGSREQMHKLAFGDQKVNLEDGADNSHIVRMKDIEKWALAQYRWACKLWGEENIIGFNVHLDELNPHCHCTVIPVATIKGKQNISFNTVFYTPKTMKERLSALHDELAVVNKPFGLERGDQVSESLKNNRIADGNRYTKQILELQEKLLDVQTRMEHKQQMLAEKQAQLNGMERRVQAAQAKAQQIELAVHSAINEVSPARMLAAEVFIDELYYSMLDVWNKTRTTVPEDDYMDKSFAGAALSAPAKVFKCGLLLFLGFVNDATTFAESNGGGGCSQSDLPWRDRDEEDAAYMRRCMFCAQKMMKPKGGYKVKKGGGLSLH